MEEYNDIDEEERLQKIKDKWNPLLIEGSVEGDIQKVKLALENDAHVNNIDKSKWNALIWASSKNHFNIVKLLCKNGALAFYDIENYKRAKQCKRPEIKLGIINNKNEKTPLQKAAIAGASYVSAYLIKFGFMWNSLDEMSNNCFHLACSSNDLDTVKVFLQTGVCVGFKNSRGHYAEELTTKLKIKQLVEKCRKTIICKISTKKFEDLELKYFCEICEDFVSKEGSVFEWIFNRISDENNDYPSTRCKSCFDFIIKMEHNLKKIIRKQNYKQLSEILEQINSKQIKIKVKLLERANYEQKKLKLQEDFLEILDKLKVVENYKKIKKQVAIIENMLRENEEKEIFISKEVLEKIDRDCSRLMAERNLRHYMSITNFENFTKNNFDKLSELVEEAVNNNVSEDYLQKAKKYLNKMDKILTAQKILLQFEQYPIRIYPPPPIWDPRGKRYLDPVTKKPMDPKKPWYLPIKPKKKKKKKKKNKNKEKEEFVVPDWAKERKLLIEAFKQLDQLTQDENLEFQKEFIDKCQDQIKRIQKENKYRQRIELDMKLIEEMNSKNKKKRQQIVFITLTISFIQINTKIKLIIIFNVKNQRYKSIHGRVYWYIMDSINNMLVIDSLSPRKIKFIRSSYIEWYDYSSMYVGRNIKVWSTFQSNNNITLGYIISQLLSSFFAALMVVLVIPFDKDDGERIVYYPRVSQNASNIQIFVLEFILSFLYVMMYFATIVDKNAPSNIFGFGVGGVMIIGYLSIGHNTGACINPVRIFGPSVMTGNVYETGILWLANLLGGIFGGFYHDFYLKKYVIEEESDSKIEDEL